MQYQKLFLYGLTLSLTNLACAAQSEMAIEDESEALFRRCEPAEEAATEAPIDVLIELDDESSGEAESSQSDDGGLGDVVGQLWNAWMERYGPQSRGQGETCNHDYQCECPYTCEENDEGIKVCVNELRALWDDCEDTSECYWGLACFDVSYQNESGIRMSHKQCVPDRWGHEGDRCLFKSSSERGNCQSLGAQEILHCLDNGPNWHYTCQAIADP